MTPRTKVIVLYGGRSTEHEISCRSAAFVLRNLDASKYDVSAIAIDKTGRFLPQDTPKLIAELGSIVPIDVSSRLNQPALPASIDPRAPTTVPTSDGPTVVFPILHGSYGEDGTLQGMLEMANVAYVGADHLGSAVGMDKDVAKKLAAAADIPVVPWVTTRRAAFERNSEAVISRALALGLPLFVKPACLGSSVGVTKVKAKDALFAAIHEAFRFDDKVLIEKGLNVREIECAVLGDYEPEVSVPGEVIPHAEFYSYDAKYIDAEAASIAVPANLTIEQAEEARSLSRKIFQALDLYGMARVDLFLDKDSGQYFFNEVNTIPGFTEISQYPMLWKASGMEPSELLEKLISLAINRKRSRDNLARSK